MYVVVVAAFSCAPRSVLVAAVLRGPFIPCGTSDSVCVCHDRGRLGSGKASLIGFCPWVGVVGVGVLVEVPVELCGDKLVSWR